MPSPGTSPYDLKRDWLLLFPWIHRHFCAPSKQRTFLKNLVLLKVHIWVFNQFWKGFFWDAVGPYRGVQNLKSYCTANSIPHCHILT